MFYVVVLNAISLVLFASLTFGFVDDFFVVMMLCLIVILMCVLYLIVNDFVMYVFLFFVVVMDDCGNSLVYVKYGVVIAGGFLYVVLLSFLMWYMWIYIWVVNVNFYYVIILVYVCM